MKSRPTVWQSTNTAYKHKGIVNGNQNNNCSLNCHCNSDCNCNNVHSAQTQSQIEYGLRNRFIPCEGEWGSEWSKVCAGICFAYVPLAVDCVVGQTMRQTMVAADATADDFGWAGGSNDRQYMANSCASMAMPRSQSPLRPHPPAALSCVCAHRRTGKEMADSGPSPPGYIFWLWVVYLSARTYNSWHLREKQREMLPNAAKSEMMPARKKAHKWIGFLTATWTCSQSVVYLEPWNQRNPQPRTCSAGEGVLCPCPPAAALLYPKVWTCVQLS